MSNTSLTSPQGDTWSGLTVEFSIDDVAVDLTGASIVMQLRKTFCDKTVALEFSTADGSVLIDSPLTGHFIVQPAIISINPRLYVYDIQVTLASGRVVTIVQGSFNILPTVTR
jgi:hypothetical protein